MSYRIVPVRKQDWEKIRIWRNSQIDILRQDHEISKKEQRDYVKKYNKQLKSANTPRTILYSFLKGKEMVGYGGFVHVNKINEHGDMSAEMSFLLNPKYKQDLISYTIHWLSFIKLVKQEAKKYNIRYWRSETFLRTNDPTRAIHTSVLSSVFNAVTLFKDGIAYQRYTIE